MTTPASAPQSVPQSGTLLELHDIHPPAPPGAWPPAPGWWLAVLLALALVALIAHLVRRITAKLRRRRRALAELTRVDPQAPTPVLTAEVSAILKRVALTRWPRTEVAALTGAEWIAFLDRHAGHRGFTQGPGRILASGPYAPPDELDIDPETVVELAAHWIRRNA